MAKHMREIAEYCIIDALRMKVSNLLSPNAWRKGILTSTISEKTKTESFLGTYVFPPIKGLENKHPVTKKHEFIAEYVLVCFDYSCLDAEQNALKVFMNTFYGKARDSKPSFFLCELARGVTSAGQRNIKLVADFVKRKEFGIKYVNTDSLYLICPEEYFQKCDEAYDSGNRISKEVYWSRIVEISIVEMEKLHVDVNFFLKENNGSSYLKISRKKCIMKESTRINNTHTLKQVVEDVFKETIRDISQINLNGVVKTAVWKPNKNNKSGLTPDPYLYQIPEPGEWFEYVIVENNSSKRPSSEIVLGTLKKLKDSNKA
ncbi:458_t:CDS:2, partial [Funneliformis geosporum]